MRLTERLMWLFGICFAVVYALEEFIWCLVFIGCLVVVIIAGIAYDGFRIFQWLFLIVFIPQCFLVFMQEYNIVAEIILCTIIFFGILVAFLYGEANFNRVKLTGPFEVGHKDIHIGKTGNAVSVFYPMDKEVHAAIMDKEPERNSDWMRYGYNTRLGGARATAPWGKTYHSHPFIWKFVQHVKMLTVQDGDLAKCFTLEDESQRKTLIPIIYSHGLTSCRTFQSGSCRDLASHGYIVFSIDHHDGTCNYSRLKGGDEKYWTSMINPDNYDTWIQRQEIRLTEVSEMIDDISNTTQMLGETLKFSPNVKINMDKLIIGGHSFGGMTAIYTAFRDERIKACFGLDAWLWAVISKVYDGKLLIKCPQYQIVTQKFSPLVAKYFNFDTFKDQEKQMKESYEHVVKSGGEPPMQDLLMLIGANHLHQHDSYLLDPLLACTKSGVCPHWNVGEVYLLNTQCLLKFFEKSGFLNDCFDMKVVEQNIAKHKDEWIAYVYKSPNQGGGTDKKDEDKDIEKETENNKEGGSRSEKSLSLRSRRSANAKRAANSTSGRLQQSKAGMTPGLIIKTPSGRQQQMASRQRNLLQNQQLDNANNNNNTINNTNNNPPQPQEEEEINLSEDVYFGEEQENAKLLSFCN